MRIVVTGYGTTGDIAPVLALADGLQRAGHHVVLVTDEGAAADAERLGLDLRVLPGRVETIVTEGMHGWKGAVSSGRTTRLLATMPRLHTREWIEVIDAAADGADLIVAMTLTIYHAGSVAQERGIRLVFGQLQPSIPTGDYPPPLLGITGIPRWMNRPLANLTMVFGEATYRKAINQVRRGRDRPKLRLIWDDVPILGAWSPLLVPASKDWAHPSVTITGPWQLPVDPTWRAPAGLVEFLGAGEPPIYVGFGSMAGFDQAARLRDAILAGLRNHRVVLSSGWAGLADTHLPEHAYPIDWVPHAWLFPRCAAVMHHCGAGTSHTALQSGTPSIPVPFTGDQPFWADRLRKLGIAGNALDPRTPTPDGVRAAAEAALALRQAAQDAARQSAVQPDGVDTAVAAIGALGPA